MAAPSRMHLRHAATGVLAACLSPAFASGPTPAALSQAAQAAARAATESPQCPPQEMGDFYWEIGDGTRVLASGSTGRGKVGADSVMDIASASKWVFGAYVLQKKGIAAVRADAALHDGLRFTSGYTDFHPLRCIGKRSVGRCWEAGRSGDDKPDPRTVGRFYYQAGHDQKLAAEDLGLASLSGAELTKQYRETLHLQGEISMATLDPLPAGGMRASASAYAAFLRSMMRHELVIGSHLGEDAVCAQPKACPGQALSSPAEPMGEPWGYSYNHWVEQRQAGHADAYSSPGLYGFYPWISGDQRFYGVVARESRRPRAYIESAQCGRAIRAAFLSALGS